MKILIAGAAGFIGSHLADRLISDGHYIIGIDNLSTGQIQNITHLEDNPNFEFWEIDVTGQLVFDGKMDAIVHMASPASPVDFVKIPIEIIMANSAGTHNLLKLAKDNNARFLFASTSECYGDPSVCPQPETYCGCVNPIGIRSVYDESKRLGETLTMTYHRQCGLDTRIVRIFNTYGPRMAHGDGRVIPNFVTQAIKNDDITVYGDGSQTRSFCFVSDTVEGIIRLLISPNSEDICYPINIGNTNEITILQLAKKIIKATGSSSKIKFHDLPKDDPKRRCPDISRANKILGWAPLINDKEGLQETINHFTQIFSVDTRIS